MYDDEESNPEYVETAPLSPLSIYDPRPGQMNEQMLKDVTEFASMRKERMERGEVWPELTSRGPEDFTENEPEVDHLNFASEMV